MFYSFSYSLNLFNQNILNVFSLPNDILGIRIYIYICIYIVVKIYKVLAFMQITVWREGKRQ